MVDLTTRNDIWLEDIKIVSQGASIVWEELECSHEGDDIVFKDDVGEVYFRTRANGLSVYETLNNVVHQNPYTLRKIAMRLITKKKQGVFGYKNMNLKITINKDINVTVDSTDVVVIYEDAKLSYAILDDAYNLLKYAEVNDDHAAKIMYDTKKFLYDLTELRHMIERVPSVRSLCNESLNVLNYEEKMNTVYYDTYRSLLQTSGQNT